MMRVTLSSALFFALCLITLSPLAVFAHEVYVLPSDTILQSLATDSINPFTAYYGNEKEFYLWGFISFVVLSTILFASVFGFLEKRSVRILHFLKQFAHPLVRLSAGVTLVVFGMYGVLFGPELPLENIFGAGTLFVQILLVALGTAILLGIYTRTAAFLAILVYLSAYLLSDWYVLTYTSYLGAYVFLVALGGGPWSLNLRMKAQHVPDILQSIIETIRPLAYPLLRVGFGLAIMLAAIYAKFWHSELAHQVVIHYNLTRFFPFEPMFVVLGAFIIEFLAGLMMFLGIAVRWTALFLAFWLTMGHIFTNEEWWVHLILYGVALAIFCHGYDRWSLEGRFLRRDGREPVL